VLTNNSTRVIYANAVVGNITLSGNATLYVHGTLVQPTLTVLGNIVVSGNSTLFVNDSTLAIAESYDVEWTIQVTGTSRFVVSGSNITTNGYQWGAAFEDLANVTILGSLVGYPSGWLDTDLVGGPTLGVAYSWYSSDVILFDNALAPSTANFTAGDSAGFNIWLNFKSGTAANLSLPGADGWRNWTYPGGANVSGTQYRVTIIDSFVLNFAIMLWQGADVTLTDSPDVVVALDIEYGSVDLSGLGQEHYDDEQISTAGLELQLWNTTVSTWNVYPFAGNVSISGSQIGEVQVFGSASAAVNDCNLTGDGGYYGNQGTRFLSIYNSTVSSQVVAYTGTVNLVNSTVNTSYPERVLATGNGTVYALDSRLGPSDTWQTLGGGTIQLAGTVVVAVSQAGSPVLDAALTLEYDSNGTRFSPGVTDSSGSWTGPLIGARYQAAVMTGWNYTLRATGQDDGAVVNLTEPIGPATVWLALLPIVVGSTPASGTVGVPQNLSTMAIAFTYPMVPFETQASVTVDPVFAWTPLWDAADENLTLLPAAPLAPATTYTLTVGTGAQTQNGLLLDAAESFAFTTAIVVLPVPAVVGTLPADRATNVSLTPQIRVSFSEAMNASRASSAFSISPAVPGLFSDPSAAVLGWVPSSPLSYNTTYTVEISTAAQSAAGAALAQGYEFEFRTLAENVTVPPPTTVPGYPASTTPQTLYLGLAIAVVVVAAVAGILVWRRRTAPPPAIPIAPAAAPVASQPAWSEEPEPPSRGTGR
jgi:hypothetical protein